MEGIFFRSPFDNATKFFLESDNLENKKLALEKIELEKIVDVLKSNYGIQVNGEFDKTIRTVEDVDDGQGGYAGSPSSRLGLSLGIQLQQISTNPYYGNSFKRGQVCR